jgi:hypothetical protein
MTGTTNAVSLVFYELKISYLLSHPDLHTKYNLAFAEGTNCFYCFSKKIPTLFSLLSALDEPRPVVVRYGGKKDKFQADFDIILIFWSDMLEH